jgi:hypothetical protein
MARPIRTPGKGKATPKATPVRYRVRTMIPAGSQVEQCALTGVCRAASGEARFVAWRRSNPQTTVDQHAFFLQSGDRW